MRLSSVLSEAFRNIVSGTSRVLLFAALLATATAALAIADARAVLDVQRSAAEFTAAGASVRLMVAKSTTDGAACERLAGVDGIRAAGALREAAPVVLRAMPANPVPAYAVTPGLIAVLGGDGRAGGAWIPRQLASALAVRPGQVLATTAGAMPLAGVYDYPDDGRDLRPAYAVLLPQAPAGAFDECWADVWPVSAERAALLHTALVVDTGSRDPVTDAQLNNRLGDGFDGAARFAARPTGYAPVGAAALGLLLGFVAVWIRRLEIAGALHLGESRTALLATLLLESAAWASAALLLAGCALVFGVVPGGVADPWDAYAVGARALGAAALCVLCGTVLGVYAVRERQLFGYFKNR